MKLTINFEFSPETNLLIQKIFKKIEDVIQTDQNFKLNSKSDLNSKLNLKSEQKINSETIIRTKSKQKRNLKKTILNLININEGLTPQEIQKMTGLTSKQVSNVVSLLKKNGIVDRINGVYFKKEEVKSLQ